MQSVKIISISQPQIPELTNPGEVIAYTARVSNPTNQLNNTTSPKLIKYLADHKHWSPFEMSYVVMEIKTTRDITHQIIRHRSFSFQEFSQRYAKAGQFITDREARLQDSKNRQNSIEIDNIDLQAMWQGRQKEVLDVAQDAYSWALEQGIAKECARVILPEGLTISSIYMAGTIRSWIHYCQTRCGLDVQKEHRNIALAVWDLLVETFPDIRHLI